MIINTQSLTTLTQRNRTSRRSLRLFPTIAYALLKLPPLLAPFIIPLITFITASISPAFAEDRVLVRTSSGTSKVAIRGLILDYTGERLTIRTQQGSAVGEYTPDQLIEVQTDYIPPHISGIEALAAGHPADARTHFQAALKAETRTWVRREILSQIVKTWLYEGDYIAAAEAFSPIYVSDKTTFHLAHLPLVWSAELVSESARSTAINWLGDQDLVKNLVAASMLLDDERFTMKARLAFAEQARGGPIPLRYLAQAQQWRYRLASPDLTPTEVARWERTIDDWPESIRGPAQYLLGLGFARFDQPTRAATAWLWVPLVFPDDRHLAALASLEAAEALTSAGDNQLALEIYQETITRFPGTLFSDKAQIRLLQLQSP
jgi:tetratricopeptide (TPR) repeat protein